ncbi:hypothetical protein AB0A69_24965 [Streptomyces sp. NPDC045431]|uniref:hypothetical protein n=1 Tax=Streptomyces sp. NPDC045431 TaxID=3155613 RepID=UPI0033E38834
MRGAEGVVERVDALLRGGYIGREKAAEVVAAEPRAASREVLEWLRTLAGAGAWARFGRFALLAAELHPEGLAEVVVPVIASGAAGGAGGANRAEGAGGAEGVLEDLVDLAGEIGAVEAVPALAALIDGRRESGADAPYFALSLKCVHALGGIGTAEAQAVLRTVATGDHPGVLRWNAAVELGIEDELGYDEDEMLGPAESH